MLSGRELALGLIGAWRLARADRTALLCFDRSPRGFWRSFWVYALLAPPQALLTAIQFDQLNISPVPFELILLQIGIYVLDALLLPAVLSEIALRTRRVPQFMAFTIAYNYAQILVTALWLAVVGLVNLAGDGSLALLVMATFALLVFFQYRIARIAFDLTPLYAMLVSLLALGLGLALQMIENGLLQPYIAPGAGA
jgi:hypothetical protein